MLNSLKILQLLGIKDMSADELTEKLGLRLSTLKYNLDSLLDADMIWVSEIKWSQRGRKIKIDKPIEKIMIPVPGCRNGCKAEILSIFLKNNQEKLYINRSQHFWKMLKTDIIFSDCRSD